MQSRHTLFHEASPPFAHGRVGQSQLPGNLLVGLSRRAQQNDPHPSHQSRRKRTGTGHAFQLGALLRGSTPTPLSVVPSPEAPPLSIRDAYFACNINATYLWDRTLV